MGFEYSAVDKHMGIAPRVKAKDFSSLYATGRSWGSVSQTVKGKRIKAAVAVTYGTEKLASFSLATKKSVKAVKIALNGRKIAAGFEAGDDRLLVRLDNAVSLKAGDRLEIAARM
jgi:hypothetical protein